MNSTVVNLICWLIVVTKISLLTNIMSMLRVIFLLFFRDIFRHDQIINHHWFWLNPGGFPFQSMDVFSINFVSSSDITCSHRKVQDEILGDGIFEVSRRRVSTFA